MAGFQRPDPNSPKTPAKSGTKIAILGALSLVLVGAMFMNLGNIRPRNAGASAGATDANAALAPTASSAQLLAQISDDPTARLLRSPEAQPKPFKAIPKDPFQPSASMLKKLQNKPTEVVPTKTTTPETPLPPSNPGLYTANLKVQAIYREGQTFKALINGAPASIGTIIADCQVISIAGDGVLFQPLNQPTSARFTLSLRSR